MSFTLSSPAFSPDQTIPVKFTGDGEDVAPALDWSEPPPGTLSLTLTLTDPDAPGGTFHHWTLVNIPPDWRGLPEGFPGAAPLGAMRELNNGFGHEGYGGPLPPHGHGPHRYIFELHALSIETLDITENEDPMMLILRLPEITLATASLIGIYER